MFIEAKKLIGMPVAANDVQSKIGEISQILVDPENGSVLGFLVKEGGFFSVKKVLAAIDITEWDPNGIVTSSVENLVSANEIIRIKNVLDKKIFLIGMSAKTESKKSLGHVEDLLIDTDTNTVAKYYLKDLLGNSRVLTSDKVVKIEKAVIFSDDIEQPPSGAAGVTA